VSARPGRGGSARPWRILAGTIAGLLILGALLLGALRLAISLVPENAARIQAWVERQTDYRLEFRGIDARMRWWGPEVVLRDVRVLDPDASQALFEAAEAAVSLDLWNLFRTGELVAGRVRIVGPAITVVRLADGRIRLLGQRERPADRPPFDLDRLPAGQLAIEDATVTYRDLMTGRGPWKLRRVQVALSRAHDAVDVTGSLRLPADLGGDVELAGRLHGSLDHFEDLELHLEANFERLRLAGLAELLPPARARPLDGAGPVQLVVAFDHGRFEQLKLDLDLADVSLELPDRDIPPIEAYDLAAPARLPGAPPLSMPLAAKTEVLRPAAELPRQVRYASLQGRLRLRREGDVWLFRASDLRLARNALRPVRATSLAARWHGHPSSAFDLAITAENVDAGDAWPLVLAVAPGSFDRWAGLDPRGTLRQARAEIVRERAGSEPRFQVTADVADLGMRPTGRWPGLSGVTARLSGTEQRGRIALRSDQPAFEWPHLFTEPITVARVEGDVDWRRDGRAWILQSTRVAVSDPRVAGECAITLRLPGGGLSPYLDLDARVDRADATLTPHVVPYGHLQPRSIAWLLMAFQQGTVSDGRVSYRGPTRRFPFRDGEGEFLATAVVRDARLTYFDGFAPLVNGVGEVEFRNAGLKAHLSSGEVGGLRLGDVRFAIPDLKHPDIEVDAKASGDLAKALAVVQGSPLGPVIGAQFMQLSGRGPADYVFSLRLPSAEQAAHDYRVRTQLHSVSVNWPVLRAPASRVTGDFEIHNREFRASSLRGVILDGPFEGSVQPGPVGGDVSATVLFSGSGRAAGALLPAFIGLPETLRMTGTADWRLSGRIERRGDGAHWPARIDVASDLRGLGIDAPHPFAKEPAEPRATRVLLDLPGTGRTEVRIDSGAARAALVFAERADKRWDLERGAARFDGQTVALPAQPGLHVAGDWPEFDLAEWLALRPSTSGGRVLSDWLGPVDVHLERARVFGFEFLDVTARFVPGRTEWRVDASGPMAEGTIRIPADLTGAEPLRLDMRRLELKSGPPQPGKAPARETDPREVPAIAADVGDFAWQDRRFGRLAAQVDRVPQGLRLSRLATESKSFTLNGTGSWLAEGQGSRTRLALELSSTNLATTARSLGYRDVVDAKKAHATANLTWSGGPAEDVIGRMDGTIRLELDDGQLRGVEPGAGRVLGLMSVLDLPRRLTLDFRDVTDEGLAFHKVRGDFEVRAGNAYTQNLLLKGPAVDVGVVGRTGLSAQDYDQTVVVSGNASGPITVAGALAGGPVGAAGALLISQIFKGQLQGLTRMYYRVTGPWSDPKVERISASVGSAAPAGGPAPPAAQDPGEGRQ
jgi:uncharacterized protein (TIGR02099 family)